MVKSETAKYVFTVKEYVSDPHDPFIAFEPSGGGLSILGKNVFLSLCLKSAISIEKAQDIANYLNDHISGVGVMQSPPNWMSYGKAWLACRFPKTFTRLRQLWLTR